jgi:ABC-type transport system substrate-binding protein
MKNTSHRMTQFRNFVVALATAALAGCGKSSGPPATAPHALPEPPYVAPCEPGQPGGRLVIGTAGSPRTFNPFFAPDAPSDQVARLLFAGLLQYDFAMQEVVPGRAP